MVVAIFQVVEAGHFRFKSCFDGWILLELIEEDFELLDLSNRFLGENKSFLCEDGVQSYPTFVKLPVNLHTHLMVGLYMPFLLFDDFAA